MQYLGLILGFLIAIFYGLLSKNFVSINQIISLFKENQFFLIIVVLSFMGYFLGLFISPGKTVFRSMEIKFNFKGLVLSLSILYLIFFVGILISNGMLSFLTFAIIIVFYLYIVFIKLKKEVNEKHFENLEFFGVFTLITPLIMFLIDVLFFKSKRIDWFVILTLLPFFLIIFYLVLKLLYFSLSKIKCLKSFYNCVKHCYRNNQ